MWMYVNVYVLLFHNLDENANNHLLSCSPGSKIYLFQAYDVIVSTKQCTLTCLLMLLNMIRSYVTTWIQIEYDRYIFWSFDTGINMCVLSSAFSAWEVRYIFWRKTTKTNNSSYAIILSKKVINNNQRIYQQVRRRSFELDRLHAIQSEVNYWIDVSYRGINILIPTIVW